MPESAKLGVVTFEHPDQEGWNAAAEWLRAMADRFEKGEILDCVVVLNDKAETCFKSWGHFNDRWRLLGALEYAKNSIHHH